MKRNNDNLTDRERILTEVLRALLFTQRLCLHKTSEADFKRDSGGEYAHFGGYDDRPIQVGDLVLAQSGRISNWSVGWVAQIYSEHHILMRDIGSNKVCDYSNESFVRIAGMYEEHILDGDKYAFYKKLLKALDQADDFHHRFRSIHFPSERVARIGIAEKWANEVTAQIEIKFTKRTTIKQILSTLQANGVGLPFKDHDPAHCRICKKPTTTEDAP